MINWPKYKVSTNNKWGATLKQTFIFDKCHWRKSLISHSWSFRFWPSCPLEFPQASARTGSVASMVASGSGISFLQLNSLPRFPSRRRWSPPTTIIQLVLILSNPQSTHPSQIVTQRLVNRPIGHWEEFQVQVLKWTQPYSSGQYHYSLATTIWRTIPFCEHHLHLCI